MAGIYIHIPYCRQACSYCNFHFSTSLKNKTALINTLCNEISLTAHFNKEEIIESVYIGGGTPSLLTPEELKDIFAALHKKFAIAAGAEITLEANPDDIEPGILEKWKNTGINRLSVGLQSFNEAELRWMNRAHDAGQALQCINDIRAAGFTDFSVDLIYGSPLQSEDDLKTNFTIIAEKNVPHISCYALTIEPKTALARMTELNRSPLTDPDKQAAQFALLLELTEAAGYEQYEISNFSKPGFHSRHNSSYWQGKPYYGFGPGAHSFNGFDIRRWNIANNPLYITSLGKNVIPFEEEVLTANQRMNEYIMTSLRTSGGLALDHIEKNFGKENENRILLAAEKYFAGSKLTRKEDFLILTKEGKFLADGVAADLFI